MDARLQAFLAKPKTYEYEGQEIKLKPFKGKQLDLLMSLSENPTAQDVRKLVSEALTHSGYETSIADAEELPVAFLNKLTEWIMDVNGFKLEG